MQSMSHAVNCRNIILLFFKKITLCLYFQNMTVFYCKITNKIKLFLLSTYLCNNCDFVSLNNFTCSFG